VAGTAGAMAATNGTAVQDVPYDALSARLKAEGQVFPVVTQTAHLEDATRKSSEG